MADKIEDCFYKIPGDMRFLLYKLAKQAEDGNIIKLLLTAGQLAKKIKNTGIERIFKISEFQGSESVLWEWRDETKLRI